MGLYLIIMGVQGAGKGTQAAFIHEQYNIPHISTGDLFRAMKTREDDLAKRVQDIMNAGQLVPDDVTNEVLRDRLEQPDAQNGVILDGYPRNIAQADWLANYLREKGERLACGMLLDLDPYTAFKRAFGRVKNAKGEMRNIYFNNERLEWHTVEDPAGQFPPRLEVIDTQTGEKLQRRADDEAVSVVKRIDTFFAETVPLIDYYREKELLLKIDARQSIPAVSDEVKHCLDKIVAKMNQ